MNLLFLLLAAALVLIALAFVLPPLWRVRALEEADMNARNIAIAKDRLHELKDQLSAGALSQGLYDEQIAELELALSDDLDIESRVSASSTQSRWMAPVLALAIPVLCAGLYWTLGNFEAVSHSEEMAKADPEAIQSEQVAAMVETLAQKLKDEPNNAEGWLMLGRSYKYLQENANAALAYERAYQLLGDKPEVMLLYADALASSNNQNLAGKPTDLAEKALSLDPDNIDALWLVGMAKAQQGDKAVAIKHWTKLAAQLPPGEALQQIQGLLVKLGAPAAQAEAAPVAVDVAIEVQVRLAPELQKSASPDDTVFVYAKALSGPPMPLAVARKKVSDLPLSVRLTDAMAMTPAFKLSKFDKVKLVARISKSGNAMPQAGDLIGEMDSVAVSDKTRHELLINSQVK